MKKLKYIILFILGVTMFTSCFDDEALIDLNDDGNNVAGFTNVRENISKIASGDEYQIPLKMSVMGPTLMELTNDITVSFAATAASTAIEGVHYRLDNPTITLTKANNYLGLANITMLTAGIDAPLAVSPVLVLQPTTSTGDSKVVASGKVNTITLNYACFSNLDAYTYTYTYEYFRNDVFQSTGTRTNEILTKTGIGEFRTSNVGHWTQADLGGTPGFTFYDVCGVLSIPGQNLVDLYSNWVEGVGNGSVDPVTGNLYMEYTIVIPPATSDRFYTATYVKN